MINGKRYVGFFFAILWGLTGWVHGQATIQDPTENTVTQLHHINIAVTGEPGISTRIELPADGETEKTVRLEIQDEWGYRLDHIKMATVRITGGKIVETDVDPVREGVQIPLKDGILQITIRAPKHAVEAVLEVELGGAFSQLPVRFTPPAEPLVLVGSLNASGGIYQTSNEDHPEVDDPYDNTTYFPDKRLFYGGRNAFYAKGSVLGEYRLTASFDSDRYHRDRLFEDLDPDEQYPIYGDASILTYDAQSESRFFAKLERGRSFLVMGDYNTHLTGTEFTAYDRSFNGILSNLRVSDKHSLVGFASLTNREMTLDEIRGQGISGYYRLSRNHITRFSEKVKIQVRDRYHPETIVKSTDLARYQDYDINFLDGTLMFKQPVPSIDAAGNPVFIVLSYEHKSTRKETAIGGLRYSGTLADRFKLGTTFIFEEQSPRDYLLYGVDARLPITRWLALKGEVAQSRDQVTNSGEESGQAYKAEFSFIPTKNVSFKGYYRNVGINFVNRSQTGRQFELGSEKYGFSSLFKASQFGRFVSEYYRQFNKRGTLDESKIWSLRMTYEKDIIGKGQVSVGYEEAQREKRRHALDEFNVRKSRLFRGQVAYRILPKVTGTLESVTNMDTVDQSKPNTTSLGLVYELSEKLSTYLKYRVINGKSNRMQTVLGFDSKITENTQLVGKYEIGGAIGEDRNQASIGLRNKWLVRDDLTVNVNYENTATVDSFEVPTPKHESLSMALEYFPELPLKTTGKYEFSRNPSAKTQVIVMGADFKILNGLSTIAKLDYADSDFKEQGGGHIIRGDYQLGLAFRPELNDVVNTIGKLQVITDNNTHSVPGVRYDRFIASVLSHWQPLDWLEFGARYARRWVFDREGDMFEDRSGANFFLLRTEVDWTLKWGFALDLRYLTLAPIREKKTGVALEANYLLIKNVQVGLGYAFRGYKDADFASTAFNYGHHNFYLTTHVKFSEDIFNWR